MIFFKLKSTKTSENKTEQKRSSINYIFKENILKEKLNFKMIALIKNLCKWKSFLQTFNLFLTYNLKKKEIKLKLGYTCGGNKHKFIC